MSGGKPLRFAMLGAGFWARFQMSGWLEHDGLECCAVYNRNRERAEQLAKQFYIPRVYDTAEELLAKEKVDFIDIVTAPETHRPFVEMCAAKGFPVVCQKPLAESLEDAEAMVAACEKAGVPLLVNENWRWQAPLREVGRLLHSGAIGKPFRGRVTFSCSFPVFDNQPFLAQTDKFILTDIGSHVLDTARYLFGEATSLYAQTRRVNPKINGEDVATVMMPMARACQGDAPTTVTCEMSYASRTEYERFPETYVFVEGDGGSLELGPDFKIRLTTTKEGSWRAPHTSTWRVPPPRFPWADPAYDLVHASIVPCHGDLIRHLRGEGTAETVGSENLKTMRLVFAAYESAASGQVVAV